MISSPSAYSPRETPRPPPSAATSCSEDGRAGRDHAGAVRAVGGCGHPKPAQIETPDEDSLSPYFTSWLRQQVVDRYGAGEAFGGGLEIQSTIDLEFQQQVEETAYSTLAGIEPTASIVVIDNKTGGVLAMVGGNDFEKEPFNLATNGHRQPGSAFKPYTLVTALEKGVSPDRVFTSQPKTFRFKAPGQQAGAVRGQELRRQLPGSASLATATTYSDNSVYAELGLEVGPTSRQDGREDGHPDASCRPTPR